MGIFSAEAALRMLRTACCAELMHADCSGKSACKASKPCLLSSAGRCLKAHQGMTDMRNHHQPRLPHRFLKMTIYP